MTELSSCPFGLQIFIKLALSFLRIGASPKFTALIALKEKCVLKYDGVFLCVTEGILYCMIHPSQFERFAMCTLQTQFVAPVLILCQIINLGFIKIHFHFVIC